MQKTFSLLFSVAILTACSSEPVAAQQPTTDPMLAAYSWYQHYCQGCHGSAMEGGSGGSLIDGTWKYGENREAIYKSISQGIEDMGMPAYGETMTDQQITMLVDLIESKKVPEQTARPSSPKMTDQISTLDYEIAVEEWVTGLSTPWDIAFLDSSTALVTEKTGGVRFIKNGVLGAPISGIPQADSGGQGGMLAVNFDPEYQENGWIYLAYSHNLPSDPRLALTRVVRGKVEDNTWTNQQTVWEGDPSHYSTTRHHYGTRIEFDSQGLLYFTIGDRGDGKLAQSLKHPNGKVHRVNRDGSIPADNPFINESGAVKSTWSYGHRNGQGISFHPITGDLWEAEHGPRGGDELNLVKKSLNYGWPDITYGINYNGSTITKERVRPGMEQPVFVWRPSTAVCDIHFYEGTEFPFWQNHLLVSSLANKTVRLLQIQNNRVIHEEIIVSDKGRVRTAVSGPDGAVYVVLNGPDEILRLTRIEEKLK